MEKLLLFKTGNNFGLNTRTSTMPLQGEKFSTEQTSDTLSPAKLQTPVTTAKTTGNVFNFPASLEEAEENSTPVDNQDIKKFRLPETMYLTDESESPEEKRYKELLISGGSKKFKTMDNKSPNAIKGDDDAAEIEDFPDLEVLSPSKKASVFSKYKSKDGAEGEEDPAKKPEVKPRDPTPEHLRKNKTAITSTLPPKEIKKDPKTRLNSKDVVSSDVDIKRMLKKQEQKLGTLHPFRHLIFSPTINEQTFKRHLTLTYRGLVYSSKCLKGPSDKFIKAKQVNLVDSKVPRFKTLLFDLDETLIHSCNLKENPQHIVKAYDDCGGETTIGINMRPFLMETLDALSQYYEIFIFTASSSNYANAIINFIDPYNKYINGILTRSNCMETKNGFFIKDLRIIRNRELKHIIIVDNLAHSFGFQIENGIPILEFHDDKKDTELKYLTDYLIQAAFVDDVREFNKKKLRLHELAQMKIEDLGV